MLEFKQSEQTNVRRRWLFQLVGQQIQNEVPAGTTPGTSFTLAFLPDPNSLKLTNNGQLLTGGGVDYTLTSQALSMVNTVGSADVFLASYSVPALTGQTGKGYISKNGATAAQTTNSMVEIDATNMPGFYYIELTASELDTLGFIGLRVKTTNSVNYEDKALVSYNDPYASQGGFVAPSNVTGSGITKAQSEDLLKKIKKMIAEQFAKYEEEEDAEEVVEQTDYTQKLDAILAAVIAEEEEEAVEAAPDRTDEVLEAIANIEKPTDFTPHFQELGGKVDAVLPQLGDFKTVAEGFQGKMSVATDSISTSLQTVKEISDGFKDLQGMMAKFKDTFDTQTDMDKRFASINGKMKDEKLEEISKKFMDLQKMMITHKYDILQALNKGVK